MPELQGWIGELALKRNAQRSNCFIAETADPRRISQFREAVRNGLGRLLKKEYLILYYDLQRSSLTDFDGQRVPLDPLQPLAQLDAKIKQAPTILIISYVFTEAHANGISDLLAAWAHDEDLYRLKSTVVVFTSSAALFSESLRRMCYTISITPSTPQERRTLLLQLAGELSKGFEQKYGKPIRIKVDEDLVQATSGLTLHDLETAALESFYKTRKFDVQVFTEYKVQLLRNYGIEYVVPSRGFESVGGYHLLKRYVQQRIIRLLRELERLRRGLARLYRKRPKRRVKAKPMKYYKEKANKDGVVRIGKSKYKAKYVISAIRTLGKDCYLYPPPKTGVLIMENENGDRIFIAPWVG